MSQKKTGLQKIQEFKTRIMSDVDQHLLLATRVHQLGVLKKREEQLLVMGDMIALSNVVVLSLSRILLMIDEQLFFASDKKIKEALRILKGELSVLKGDMVSSAKTTFTLYRVIELQKEAWKDVRRSEENVAN